MHPEVPLIGVPNKPLVPTRTGEAPVLAAQRRRSALRRLRSNMRWHSFANCRSVLLVIICGLTIVGCTTTPPDAEEQRVIYPRVASAYPLSQPQYPDDSRRRADQGLVSIEVFIEKDGRVTDARILMSSGHEELDASTFKEVFIWRFVPGRLNGKPTAMWNIYTVTFSLYDKRYPMPDQTAALAELKKVIHQRKTELATKAMAAPSP